MSLKLITYTTRPTARLAANWLLSLQREGIDDLAIVFCGDEHSERCLSKLLQVADNAATVTCPEVMGCFPVRVDTIDWGSPEYSRIIAKAKIDLWLSLSQRDSWEPFLYCDADTVIVNDPVDYLDKLAPDLHKQAHSTGIAYFGRNERAVLQCAKHWLAERLPDASEVFVDENLALGAALEFFLRRPKILDPLYFPEGDASWGDHVLIAHASQVGSPTAKEGRLRVEGEWHLTHEMASEVWL